MPSPSRPAALALAALAACVDGPAPVGAPPACCPEPDAVETVDMPRALTIGDRWHWRVPARSDFPASAWILSFAFVGPDSLSLTPGTNLIAQPDDLGHACWTRTGGAVIKDGVRAPTTLHAADRFVEDTSTGMHGIELATNLTITAGTIHSIQLDIRRLPRGASRHVRLAFGDQNDAPYIIVDPATGAIVRAESYGSGLLGRYEVVPLADGWFRLTLAARAGITDTVVDIGIYLTDASSPPCDYINDFPYTGDGASGIYLANVWAEGGLYEPSAWRIGATTLGGWDVTVPQATTAGYAAGRFGWAAFVTEAATGSRHPLAAGWVVLRRD